MYNINIDKEWRCRNDNNTTQTKYTHGVAVKPEPQKVKERVMEDGEKRSLQGYSKSIRRTNKFLGGNVYEVQIVSKGW